MIKCWSVWMNIWKINSPLNWRLKCYNFLLWVDYMYSSALSGPLRFTFDHCNSFHTITTWFCIMLNFMLIEPFSMLNWTKKSLFKRTSNFKVVKLSTMIKHRGIGSLALGLSLLPKILCFIPLSLIYLGHIWLVHVSQWLVLLD